MTDLSVNMVTANIILSVFFLSGALAACPQDLFITTPKTMKALSGSCLQIPCNFSTTSKEEFNSTRSTFGVWVKNHLRVSNSSVVFNSSRMNNQYPMSITGNLREKNCTTLFSSLLTRYTDTYYFRLETWPFRATAQCDPVHITVNDSPPSPSIEISGDLREEESATITCSALTPCPHSPPKLTWNLQQDPHNNIEKNADGTFTTKIQTTITLSDQHDGYDVTCSASYPVNEGKDVKTAEERQTLSVLHSPKDTTVFISPTGSVSAGSVVNLTCSCRGNPPVVHFVWFMISDGRLELIRTDTQVYSFQVTSNDRGRSFYCGCRNDLDIQLSTGRQLILEGDRHSELSGIQVGLQVIVKIVGLIMLISILIIFECWFRSRRSTKPVKDAEEPDYVNTGAAPST